MSWQCLAICHTNSIVLPQKAWPILNAPIAVAEGITARGLQPTEYARRLGAVISIGIVFFEATPSNVRASRYPPKLVEGRCFLFGPLSRAWPY